MKIEYEATFTNIDVNNIRNKLSEIGATLVHENFLQKRVVFFLPTSSPYYGNNAFARVRSEYDKTTMSIKYFDNDAKYQIDSQKEICLEIDDFDEAVAFLENSGFVKKSYQETKREKWMVDDVEICIDEWPWLDPFLEIEGYDEDSVKDVSKKLGLDYKDARFIAVSDIYVEKYNISFDIINNNTPEILFDKSCPF